MRPIFYFSLVALIATGAYFWVKNTENKNNQTDNPNQQVNVYEGWQAYENKKYNIAFKVPSDWELKEQESDNLILKFMRSNSSVVLGDMIIHKTYDDYGRGAVGPKTSDSSILISGLEANQKIFEGENKPPSEIENQVEEKIYKEIIIEFSKSPYFYYLAITEKSENQKFWIDFNNFIKSIEVK